MTCEGYQEEVSQYVDRELGERESANLFGHLGTCSVCREFLKEVLELRSQIYDDILKREPPKTKQAKKKIELSITTAVITTVMIILSTIAVFETILEPGQKGSSQVVYMMSLPIVEIQGNNPNEDSNNQKW